MPSQVVRPVRRDGLSGWIMRTSSPFDSSSVYAGSGLGYSGDVVERSGAGFYASPTLGMEFLGHPLHVSRWSYARLCHFIKSNHQRVPLNGTLEFP